MRFVITHFVDGLDEELKSNPLTVEELMKVLPSWLEEVSQEGYVMLQPEHGSPLISEHYK